MKHKFINKKTGAEARVIAMYLDSDGVMQVDGYDAVEDLMDDYAAYEEYAPPKEPLIKNEKVRKAVRVWAEANGFSVFKVYNQHFNSCKIHGTKDRYDPNGSTIEFLGTIAGAEKITYEIDQLCGEEAEAK